MRTRAKKVESAGVTYIPPSTRTRKAPAKRARSPETVDSDAVQPKSKRSKSAKPSGTTKSRSKTGSTNHATTPPVAAEVSPITQVSQSHPPPPTFAGNFDLYDMELPFLSKVYLPTGASTPQYEDLFNTILTYQAKDDNTAQFFLASPTASNDASIFTSSAILDPMEEFPFDISIRSIKHHLSLSLPSDKLPSIALVGPDDGPGVSASMTLEDSHCGIQSSSGMFKLKRVWAKYMPGTGFAELFAGYLSFDISYSAIYKRKGHGMRQSHKWTFWAIRARTGDDGKEVGLRPMLPVSVLSNAGTPPTHPAAATAGKANPGTAQQLFGPPKFAGGFKLYSMCDLIEEHLPEAPFPSSEDVYNVIADASPDITAKCRLGAPSPSLGFPGSDFDEADSEGQFRGTTICDPFVEQPYDVVITSIEEEESLSFTEDELGQFPTRDSDPTGPGITAQVTLSESDHPGVASASGYIKFMRVWAKKGDDGELLEVFEAYLNLDVSFELSFKLSGHRFRGHSTEETHALAFWAIRSGKDDDDGRDWFPKSSESHFC